MYCHAKYNHVGLISTSASFSSLLGNKLPEQIAVIFDATNRLIINIILACSVI